MCSLSCLSAPKKIEIEWRLILATIPHGVWSPSNYSLFAWILARRILENSDFWEDGYCYISCWKRGGNLVTEREKRSRNSAAANGRTQGSVKQWKTAMKTRIYWTDLNRWWIGRTEELREKKTGRQLKAPKRLKKSSCYLGCLESQFRNYSCLKQN